MSHLDSALDYARRGWPVFPLHGIAHGRCTCGRECGSPGKHPLVRRGLHEATTDAHLIKEWWSRWRHANIAIATGERSGIVVIDIDLYRRSRRSPAEEKVKGKVKSGEPKDVWTSLDRVIHRFPRTRVALTGGGGIHLLLRALEDRSLHNHASRLPGLGDLPGIDLRADGGYVVAPPSVHISGNRYSWLERADEVEDPHHRDQHCEAESYSLDQSNGVFGHGFTIPRVSISAAPDWLREPERKPTVIAPPRFRTGDGTPHGLAALRRQLDILSRARVGERNHTLNRCAFIVGLFIRSGHVNEAASRNALQATGLATGLASWEVDRTIASAFEASK